MDLHPAIESFLSEPRDREIVVCIEIKEQLGLTKRRLRISELREAYEALVTDGAEEVLEVNEDIEVDVDFEDEE